MSLWFAGVVLYLFFATALGVFLGTISRSMAQFALLIVLVVVVLQLLSGGSTPVESQPAMAAGGHVFSAVAALRQLLAGDHLSWRRIRSRMAATSQWSGAIGLAFFTYSVALFRKSIAVTK